MSKENALDQFNKNTDRSLEKREDTNKLLEEAILDLPLIKSVAYLFSDGLVAQEHSGNILQTARDALRKNDVQEAAHQLKRDLDFCQRVPKMSNSPYVAGAKAGLEAIKAGKSCHEVDHVIQEAYIKSWSNNPNSFDVF